MKMEMKNSLLGYVTRRTDQVHALGLQCLLERSTDSYYHFHQASLESFRDLPEVTNMLPWDH
jgi:hypothetical protein